MVRAVLIFLLVVGLGASLLSTRHLGNSAKPQQVIAIDDAENSSATLSSLDTDSAASDVVTLQRQPDGHFYADPEINGARVRMDRSTVGGDLLGRKRRGVGRDLCGGRKAQDQGRGED